MTKRKTTKRALVVSALSLILCVSMLVGSTYAWFTDSVTSGSNIIKSGDLEVTMEWFDGTKAVPAIESEEWIDAGAGPIFEYDLWEPGYTEVRHIKIANEGNLALKYQLSILANGAVSKLADAIDVYYVDPAVQVTGRTDLTEDQKLGTLTAALEGIGKTASGELLAGESETITIALKMRETAGNEYQELAIGSDFSIQLLATQLTYEKDSFDDQYDAGATVDSMEELLEALNAADEVEIILGSDFELTEKLAIPAGKKVTLNLNSHTIGGISTATGANFDQIDVRGELTVKNGTVTTKHEGANMGWNNSTNVFNVTAGGILNLENVTVENLGGSDMAFGVHLNNWGEVTLNAKNSVFKSPYVGVRAFNSGYDMNNITLDSCTFLTEGSCFWVHNWTADDFGGDASKAAAADARLNLNFTNSTFTRTNGSKSVFRFGFTNAIYYSDAEFTQVVAGSEAAVKQAMADGKDVLLNNDFTDFPVETTAPYGNYYGVKQAGGVFDGNGKTLDFDMGLMKNGKYDNYGIMTSGGTIKNVTITGVFRGIVLMDPTETTYIDNVVIGDDDVCYAINTAEGDGTQDLVVTNSTIKGWSSYGNAIKSVSFTDCTFKQGTYYTDVYGRLVKPYVNTVFENCEFDSKFYIDLSALMDDQTVTLKNCTVNGVKLTSENWTEMIASEADCAEGQISIEAKNGTYMTASNVLDYVVIK